MKSNTRRFTPLKTFFICVFSLVLSACAIYKPELSQGNLLTTEQIAKLQVGMSKSQVQLLLGSPLLQDVFHANRWEYIFRQIKGEKTLDQRVFTVEFDASGKLSKWTGIGKSDVSALSLSNPLAARDSQVAQPEITAARLASIPAAVPDLPLALASGLNQRSQNQAAPQTSATQSNAPKQPLLDAQNDAKNELTAAIQAWRADWVAANFAAYIAHYSASFKGSSRDRASWEADRKRMIAGRKIVSITLTDMTVQQTSSSAARAYFKQRFEAVNFQETGEKTLLLERVKGQWLITSETFNKA